MWHRQQEGVTVGDIIKKNNPEVLYYLDSVGKNMNENSDSDTREEVDEVISLIGEEKKTQTNPEINTSASNSTQSESTRPRIDLNTINISGQLSSKGFDAKSNAERNASVRERLMENLSNKDILNKIEDADTDGGQHNIDDKNDKDDFINRIRQKNPSGGTTPVSIEEEFITTLQDCGINRGIRFIAINFFKNPDDPNWLWEVLTEAGIINKTKRMVIVSWYQKTPEEMKINTDVMPGKTGASGKNSGNAIDAAYEEIEEQEANEVKSLARKAKLKNLKQMTGHEDIEELVEVPIINNKTGIPMADSQGRIITTKVAPRQLLLLQQFGGANNNGSNGQDALMQMFQMLQTNNIEANKRQSELLAQLFMNKGEANNEIFKLVLSQESAKRKEAEEYLKNSTPEAVIQRSLATVQMLERNQLLHVDRDDPIKKQQALADTVKGAVKDVVSDTKGDAMEFFKMIRDDMKEERRATLAAQGVTIPDRVKMDVEEKREIYDQLTQGLKETKTTKPNKRKNDESDT